MITNLFSHTRLRYNRKPAWFSKHNFTLFTVMVAGSLLLASCSPKPVLIGSGPAETQFSASSTSVSLTPAPTIQTYLVMPNDQTQARLRIGNCIYNGPAVDIYVNGETTDNGGIPYVLHSFDFSGYLYLPPGKIQLAVTPQGAGLDKALFAPLDVTLEAGHRYTVAVLGQKNDAQHDPLVIDETKVIKDTGATNNQFTFTLINNLKGVDAFDHIINGKVNNSKVPFGGYQAEVLPPPPLTTDIISVSGTPDKIIDPGGPTTGPDEGSVDSVACISGKYPGIEERDYGFGFSAEYTNLSLLDFLKHYIEQNQALNDPSNSFNTFLALVKTAGMTDALNNSPHYIFVPTDAAFSILISKPKLDALLADPKAAEALLKEHIVEGYYPYGSLSSGGGAYDRTLTAMSGRSLKLLGDPITINGADVGSNLSIIAANGSRFQSISTVLQTP